MAEGIILPPGVEAAAAPSPAEGDRVMVVNETGLPDREVQKAIEDVFVESASMAWGHNTTFQTYAAQGSLLARSEFKVPSTIIEEIKLARDLAERDDDVAATLGWLVAAAFEAGMQNYHRDEKTKELFNAVAAEMKLDDAFAEMYREWLISAQLNTVMLFRRKNLEWQAFGSETIEEENVATPLMGVLPAENIRILGNDIFKTGTLCYDPDSESLRRWLDQYFDERTTPAQKAALGRADPVSAAMFTGVIEVNPLSQDIEDLPSSGTKLYTLNPRMVHRSTMPKGAWKYPRPPLTRNFALLEAKRLLNIMDYALLQGGSNYVVVAKKGSDDRPALPEEIENLKGVVRTASKTGVIVGDHRLDFDILTPDLEGLLNPTKRRLLGRKLAMALMRVPEHGTEEPGGEGMKAELQIMSRVISHDRNSLRRHVEATAYQETRRRNPQVFTKGTASVWFPKIILESTQFFTDLVLKLRDRGDIPRRWAVEAAGYNFEAALEEREREVENDVDEKMAPAAVPFASPEMGPQDNQEGRPRGSQDGRPSLDPGRPGGTRPVSRTPGETIRAYYDPSIERLVRIGRITEAILEEYGGSDNIGRIRQIEREAMEGDEPVIDGGSIMVPVNPGYETINEKAVNLSPGLRMIVGEKRGSGAYVAKLMIFRDLEFDAAKAEEMTARWGFPVPSILDRLQPEETAAATPAMPNITVEVHNAGGKVRKTVLRGEDGEIIGSEEEPVEEE